MAALLGGWDCAAIMPPHFSAIELMAQSLLDWPGRWTILLSSAPLATQLDLRDRWDVPSYVPQYRASIENGGRRRREWRVLFPGYVAAKAELDSRVSWKRTRFVLGDPIQVADSMQDQLGRELHGVERMLQVNPCLRRSSDLVPGRRVKITDGVLAGIEGSIVRDEGRDLFALDVRMLGATLLEHVPLEYLEAI